MTRLTQLFVVAGSRVTACTRLTTARRTATVRSHVAETRTRVRVAQAPCAARAGSRSPSSTTAHASPVRVQDARMTRTTAPRVAAPLAAIQNCNQSCFTRRFRVIVHAGRGEDAPAPCRITPLRRPNGEDYLEPYVLSTAISCGILHCPSARGALNRAAMQAELPRDAAWD